MLVECTSIIIGFNLKDKLGQILLAQNTYLDTYLTPIGANPGDAVEATFTFRLPILPIGNYAVDVAIADGSPKDSVQLQWAHDVFVLESQASSIMRGSGLIGLSYDGIELHNKGLNVANGT